MSHFRLRVMALSAAAALALSGLGASSAQAADPLQAPAGTTLDKLYSPDAWRVPGTPAAWCGGRRSRRMTSRA